ncbi:MAG: hypothetical protein IPK28_20890 [Devosia sp.]|nr:hypothetical protein [Devosia sp.]
MTQIETANPEHAVRTVLAWMPESHDGRTHYVPVLLALGCAAGILLAASVVLTLL